MRRLLPILAFLIWVAPAHAAPTITVSASPALGPAPLDVTLTAAGDGLSYHWNLGDGSQADGAVVQHRYEAGKYTATVTATGADGTTAQASVRITAVRMTLTGPKVGTYGRRATFTGRLVPALRGAPVSLFAGETAVRSGKADRRGRFHFRVRLRAPGAFTARFYSVASNQVEVPLRPRLDVALPELAHSRAAARPARGAPAAGKREPQHPGLAPRPRAPPARVCRPRRRAPQHPQGRQLRGPGHRRADRDLPRADDDRPLERAAAVPLGRQPRSKRADPRATAGRPPVRDPGREHVLLLRHLRRRPCLSEGARNGPHRPRRSDVLAAATGGAGATTAICRRRPPHRGGQEPPGALRGRSRPGRDGWCTSRPARPGTLRSAAGTSTARCPEPSPAACSTRPSSCAASRSTATRRFRRTRPRTAACGFRCGSRRASSRRTATAGPSTSYY